MAIVQISKIQVRTGSYDDLPQLATGEIGFCTDTRQAFIGNDPNLYPPANSFTTTQTEILTSGSVIPAQGSDGQVQYNKNGSFAASAGISFDYLTNQLYVYNLDGNGVPVGNPTVIGASGVTANNVTIRGNLEVQGTAIYANTSNLQVSDPVIELNVSNTGNLPSSLANASTGVKMHTYSNTNIDGNVFMGWAGNGSWVTSGNATYGNIANSFVFGTTATFDPTSSELTALVLAPATADSLKLTSNSLTALNIINGGANIKTNLTVGGSASFANGDYVITAGSGGTNTSVTIANTVSMNIGGIVFQNGNANLPANGTIYGNFAGNITLPANANISAPGGVGNTGQLLFNNSGNVGSNSAVTLSGGTLTLAATDIAVNGGDVTTTSASATLFNANATTLAIGGAATSITVGATSGTLNLRNPSITGAPTVNLFGNSTTVYIGNTATDVNIGPLSALSKTTINDQLVVKNNANIQTDLYVFGSSYFGTAGGSSGTATIYSNGRGVFGNANISGDLNAGTANFSGAVVVGAGGSLTVNNSSQGASGTGAIYTAGGIGTAGASYIGGQLQVNNRIYQTGSSYTNTLQGYLEVGQDLTLTNSGALLSSRNIQTSNIAATGGTSGSTGIIIGNWSLSSGSRLNATYADLAEMYWSDEQYEPGTVVVFGGNREVTQSTTDYDSRVAGVVSTEPAYVMNSKDDRTEYVPVAMTGRVPCRVLGPVAKGTVLVTSGLDGTAQAITDSKFKAGVVIGKALEEIRDSTVKTIEVVVGRF